MLRNTIWDEIDSTLFWVTPIPHNIDFKLVKERYDVITPRQHKMPFMAIYIRWK
jgi:hypothetical protein